MFIIHILRWLRGYRSFCVPLDSAGRLMNLCTRNGIFIWDVWQDEDGFFGHVSDQEYRRLCRMAASIGIGVREQAHKGFLKLVALYRKRLGIAFGLLLFCAALSISQQFVWMVEIEGCEQVSQAQLIQILESLGVTRGIPKKKIDLFSVSRQVQIQVKELSWAALNLHGTTAILRVRERTPPPPKIDLKTPANVVASQDGQIVRLRVTDGKPVLQKGDTVRKNEIIVSGVWQDRWGMTHLIRANAEVMAHVPLTLETSVPLKQEEYILTGAVERRKYLEFAGLRIPLFLYTPLEGEYKTERISNTPVFFGADMPFCISQETYIFYDKQEALWTQEQALRIAQRQLDRLEREQIGGNNVVDSRRSAALENGKLILKGDYEVEMDIAEQREITVFDRSRPDISPPREGGY